MASPAGEMEDVDHLLALVRREAAERGPQWVAQQVEAMAAGGSGMQSGRVSARISRPPERLSPSASPRGMRRSGSPMQASPAPPPKKGSTAKKKGPGAKQLGGTEAAEAPRAQRPKRGQQPQAQGERQNAAASSGRSGHRQSNGSAAGHMDQRTDPGASTSSQARAQQKPKKGASKKGQAAAAPARRHRDRSSSSDDGDGSTTASPGRPPSTSPPRHSDAPRASEGAGHRGSSRGQPADGVRTSDRHEAIQQRSPGHRP
ncbi:brain acid soluble protein 1-like [Hyperolius riggenbachi]|uniref:brain acid soluble protein 1-like n=1 Tax=Hyperolius riggenbachi TaxID=752182 RepID=UPI0035A2F19B